MTSSSRTAQFTRLHRILKRAYSPVSPDPNRSVLEHLLFAACLENAHYPAAEEAFASLVHNFFDWNEVRVSSVRELSEAMANLPDPVAAAQRVKRILQNLFEATYSFDLEELRKQNLGPAIERLEKLEGTTRFTIAYVVQSALGGHSIPVDAGTLGALRTFNLINDNDVAAGVVPGLERAIGKNVGIEFGSLLHQLGADYVASPYSPSLHALLLEIEPKAKDQLPSRRGAGPILPETAPRTPAAEAKSRALSPATKPARPASAKPAAEVPAGGATAGKPPTPPTKKKSQEAKKRPARQVSPPELAPPSPADSGLKKEKTPDVPEADASKKKPLAPPKSPPLKTKSETADTGGKPSSSQEGPGPASLAKRKPR